MPNPNTDPTENEPTAPMDLDTARRVEQEKLTRRAALRKLGFGAGMGAFMLLGVDDFARMVGKRMERMAGDNKAAETVAKEFQGAGVAFAGGPSWICGGCVDNCKAGPFQKCTPCTLYPCTGSHLDDVECNSLSYAQCQACCHSRNSNLDDYNNCVSFSKCQ